MKENIFAICNNLSSTFLIPVDTLEIIIGIVIKIATKIGTEFVENKNNAHNIKETTGVAFTTLNGSANNFEIVFEHPERIPIGIETIVDNKNAIRLLNKVPIISLKNIFSCKIFFRESNTFLTDGKTKAESIR